MSIHAGKIVAAHRLVESVPGISEPVRVGVHKWISHMQMEGLADRLPCLSKRSLCAIEQAVRGNAIESILRIVPYYPQYLIQEIQNASAHMRRA